MKTPPRATRDDDDDDADSAADGALESQSDCEREGSRAAMRRLQATLTAAMEHMEGAQLEFFHVQRALAARQRRRRRAPAADTEPSWSVRVRLYAAFWARFEAQLRSALAPGEATDRALVALGAIARNVWGETRTPPRDAFRAGALVLTPAAESADSDDDDVATGDTAPSARKKQKAVATAAETATASAAMAWHQKKLAPKRAYRTKEAAEVAAAREKAADAERQRRRRHLSAAGNGEEAGGHPPTGAAGREGDGASTAAVSLSAEAAGVGAAQSPERRTELRKAFGSSSSDEGDEQTALQLLPLMPTEAGDNDANDVSPAAAKSQRKDESLARVRRRVRAQLAGDEVWPNLRLPFPKHLLLFDAATHPKLASAHEMFWRKNVAAFLDIVYSHPTQAERARLHQSKMRLLRRQRALLTDYIETLGVEAVAHALQTPAARGAFFFVRKYISLEQLSAAQLDEHLAHVHSPWTSPVTRAREIPWWDVFTRKGARQEIIVDASDRVKRAIARAHFRGALAFDTTWTKLATQPPWHPMLDALREVVAGEEEDDDTAAAITTAATAAAGGDALQSPPLCTKVSGGGVMIKEEHLGATTSCALPSPQRGLQERIVMQFSSASDDSSSSDESAFEGSSSRQRSSLGKRLRTGSTGVS